MKKQHPSLSKRRLLWDDLIDKTNKSDLRKALYDMFYEELYFDSDQDQAAVVYNDHYYVTAKEINPFIYTVNLDIFLLNIHPKKSGLIRNTVQSYINALRKLPRTIDLLDVSKAQLRLLADMAQNAAIVTGALPQNSTFVDDLMQHYYPDTTIEEWINQQDIDQLTDLLEK